MLPVDCGSGSVIAGQVRLPLTGLPLDSLLTGAARGQINGLVGGNIMEHGFVTLGPPNPDLIDDTGAIQAEMLGQRILGLKIAAHRDFPGLGNAASPDFDAGAYGMGVTAFSAQFYL